MQKFSQLFNNTILLLLEPSQYYGTALERMVTDLVSLSPPLTAAMSLPSRVSKGD